MTETRICNRKRAPNQKIFPRTLGKHDYPSEFHVAHVQNPALAKKAENPTETPTDTHGFVLSPYYTNLSELGNREAGVGQRIYIGQYSDAATALDYLNARYYNPAQGQFLTQDPVFLGQPIQQNLQDPQSLNPYSYSRDNPVTKSDPSGLYTRQQNTAIANVAAAFGVKNFSFGQSAAIGGLASSFGVSTPLITNLTGVSSEALAGSNGLSQYNPLSQLSMLGNGTNGPSINGTSIVGFGSALSNVNKYPFGDLPDNTLICRGGSCTPESFANDYSVATGPDSSLSGVSVQVGRNGESVEELLSRLPTHFDGEGQFTTVGELQEAGGELVQQGNDAGHGLISGPTAEELSNIFSNEVEGGIDFIGNL